MMDCLQQLSRIHAPSLEELSLVDCGLTDEDFEEVCRTVIIKHRNLIAVDLSHNSIIHFTDHARDCFPRDTLLVLILDGNPIVSQSHDTKVAKKASAFITLPYLNRVKELVQYFPHLGYVGQDWANNDVTDHSSLVRQDVQRILMENRTRARRAVFRSLIMDVRRIVPSLWPLILERSLRCFFVSMWDVHHKYSATCSIFKGHDMTEADAIYTLLRDRGAGDIFR